MMAVLCTAIIPKSCFPLSRCSIYILYIGGSFLNAGGKPAAYFGRNGGQSYLYLPMTVR